MSGVIGNTSDSKPLIPSSSLGSSASIVLYKIEEDRKYRWRTVSRDTGFRRRLGKKT